MIRTAVEVDGERGPLHANEQVHASIADERLTKEVDRCNVEGNLTPVPLSGAPFGALRAEMDEIHQLADAAAGALGGGAMMIGTLPTMAVDHPRARRGHRRAALQGARPPPAGHPHRAVPDRHPRRGPSGRRGRRRVAGGREHLVPAAHPGRAREVRRPLQRSAARDRAGARGRGQLPFFLGHRFWEETRIALFEQSVDLRDGHRHRTMPSRVSFGSRWLERSAMEILADAVRTQEPILSDEDPRAAVHVGSIPGLDELRMHLGSIWTWNRAVYDPAGGGHLRIELRALPAGPTTIDMAANAAFLPGLTVAAAEDALTWTRLLPFEQARDNFLDAARHGIDAMLLSPFQRGGLERVPAPRAGPAAARARDRRWSGAPVHTWLLPAT
jgi:hypothetical protein